MSGRQFRNGQAGSGVAGSDDPVPSDETRDLRNEVRDEMATEEESLSLIGRHAQRSKKLVPLLIGLLVINIVLAFILPNYGIYWIIAGFFIYMYYFIVLLIPTTRRARTPAEKKAGVKPKRRWARGAKVAVMRGKKAVTIAFWNSFFIGTQTLARGITLMLAISIVFTVLALASGTLDQYSAAIIIAQSVAIVGFYYVIIRFRPYSKDFLHTLSYLRLGRGAGRRWQAYLRGVLATLVLLTVLAIFMVSAIFIPRTSVEAVLSNLGPDIGLLVTGLAVIFISQFVLVRYVQGFDSARITTRFIRNKMEFLDRDVLGELDRMRDVGTGANTVVDLHSIRDKFLASRIYKVVYKDIFGVLPTYPIIVDFRSVLDEEVADALGAEIPIDISSRESDWA